MFEIFLISPLRRLMIKKIIKKVLGPMFELYHVVHYDSKCSTKFHKDCMFEFLLISLLRRLMIFLIFFLVLGPMFDTELLQHSKLNCTV